MNGTLYDELIQCLSINIVHQNAVGGLGQIANQMGMLEWIAQFELLLQGGHILRIGAQFRLQPFQEVQLSVEFNAVALACSATDLQQLCIWEGNLCIRKKTTNYCP